MKKLWICIIVLAMSLMSVSANYAQEWEEMSVPFSVTIAVSDTEVFVFEENSDIYHIAETPLSEDSDWRSNVLPEIGVLHAEFAGNLFALFENGNLYERISTNWTLILSNVNGISSSGDKLFAWSDYFIFEYEQGVWTYQEELSDVIYVAGGNSIIVATNYYTLYQGPRLNELSLFKDGLNINVNEILIFEDGYVYVGEAIGGLAAYHRSPLDVCFIYNHIMTSGRLNSVAAWHDIIFVAGKLGHKGVIFDSDDMSRLSFFDQEIIMTRSSEQSIIALAGDKLYYQSSTATNLNDRPAIETTSSVKIAPNPVSDGHLRLFSELKTQAQVFNTNGQQVSHLFIQKGENTFNVASWPAGVYFVKPKNLDGLKFIINK